MARFYDVDGYEVDVQDPTFHIDNEHARQTKETIEHYLSDYDD